MDNELFYQLFKKILKLWVPMVFVTAIIVIVAGTLLKYDEIDFEKHKVSSTAEIIGFTDYGYPVFSYVVDGKEYKVRSTSQISDASVGSRVKITYHSGKPSYVQVGENPIYWMALPMIVFGSLGAILTGVLMVRKAIKKIA
ncbi:MAG: hypothetical protein ACOYWZ_10580 [Bacillota bacterium]